MHTTNSRNAHGYEQLLGGAIKRLESNSFNLEGEAYLQSFRRRLILDLGFAAVAGVASAPLLTALGVGIKLHDGGPVIYRDDRVGFGLKSFQMAKLRSMKVDCGEGIKCEGDARTTKIGKFIRKMSIDELPQVYNIIKGEMSVVGPRPLRALQIEQGLLNEVFANQKDTDAFLYDVYGRMKPGLTGPNQVAGVRDFTAGPESLAAYVRQVIEFYENASPQTDIAIMSQTLSVVVGAEQAY